MVFETCRQRSLRRAGRCGVALAAAVLLWSGEVVGSDRRGMVDAGKHWAFQPVVKPEIAEGAGHPVDILVREKLGEKGMVASPLAEKRVLARRAAYGLTGLPPGGEALEAYLQGDEAGGWERYVDALLATPAYGERWGRHWLDVARYADTQGYQAGGVSTLYPYAYTYRDWVIGAFNRDLPYDRFLKLQLAADHYHKAGEADASDLAALGFLTVGPRFLGKVPEIFDDRIDVIGRGMLGLTVACARCHDHKFDPVPTSEYYGLYGILHNSFEPEELPQIGESPNADQQRKFEEEKAKAAGKITAFREEFHREMRSPEGVGNYLATALKTRGMTPEQKQVEVVKAKLREKLVEKWEEALGKLAGAAEPHPVFRLWVEFEKAGEARFGEVLGGKKEAKEFENPVDGAIGEAVARRGAKTMEDIARAYGEVIGRAIGDGGGMPVEVRELVGSGVLPTGIGVEAVEEFYNRTDREHVSKLKAEVKKLEAEHPGAPPRAMVVNDVAHPTDGKVFLRGDPHQLGDVAPRRFFGALGGQPLTEGSGRWPLAEAVGNPANPLTARVMVNRIWMYHFGTPLVETPSDFGVQCPEPEHRKLLDYLAARFVESGWSVKAMHRHIMTSETYRQSSAPVAAYLEKDPDNRFFWRMARRHRDFEAMRDTMLHATGELSREVGGRPFDLGEGATGGTRRTVYAKIDRQLLQPVFATFDFANPDAHAPSRVETMVPQKALFMLNGEFAVARAKALVEAEGFKKAGTDDERTRFLYGRLFGRAPGAEEMEMARQFVNPQGSAPAPPPTQAPGAVWKYGYARVQGGIENGEGGIAFQAFAHVGEDRWMAGREYPDKELGWVGWGRGGGHPGEGALAAVMRWEAPRDMTVEVRGEVERPHESGNGVRASIWKGGKEVVFGAEVKPKMKIAAPVAEVALKKGEALEFVVEAMGDPSFDSFRWVPMVLESGKVVADAERDFVGPPPVERRSEIGLWAQLAQVLLISNEFAFVD